MIKVRSIEKVTQRAWSKGASILAARSSRYSLLPSKLKWMREGMMAGARGGEFVDRGRDVGVLNCMVSFSRFGNVARQDAIASGKIYPESGIS